MIENRKEDYQLFVTLENDKIREGKVRCKVYLPKKLTDPIALHFFPTENQVPHLRNVFEFSLQGDIESLSGVLDTSIQAQKVYSTGFSSTAWGPEITEHLLTAEPADLQVIHFLSPDASNFTHKQTGSFWLTPSILLRPAKWISKSRTGDVRVETVRQFNFALTNGLRLIFDDSFRYSVNDEGDTVTFTELIARYEVGEIDNIREIARKTLTFLDDFLLLVSLAERHRCICLGWETVDSKCVTEYYRRDLTIPTPKKDEGHDDTLIPPQKWQDFIEKTYQKFVGIELKENIRQAIQYTIYREGRTVENSFLTLFTALETLLEHFGLRPYIIDPKQFKKTFLEDLREWIKKQPLFAGKKAEFGLMCEKLLELNRVSFRSAFNGLCNSHPVFLGDLWPIINNTKEVSLYDIRNKLVHGETFFNPLQQRALLTAEKHLRWSVERFILSVLGWGVSASNVSKGALYSQVIPCYEHWKTDQNIL
ncbi:MAG: hypothetical protein ABSG44_11830 [Thermodesulfobacteriota bacterium]